MDDSVMAAWRKRVVCGADEAQRARRPSIGLCTVAAIMLKRTREAAGLSLKEMAMRCYWPLRAEVGWYESGLFRPRDYVARGYDEALGRDPSTLIGEIWDWVHRARALGVKVVTYIETDEERARSFAIFDEIDDAITGMRTLGPALECGEYERWLWHDVQRKAELLSVLHEAYEGRP